MALELPFAALLDTSAFLCRLGEKPENPDTPACIDFCDRMVRHRRPLFVAAPTISEVTRGRGAVTPKVPGIVVVPFDERAGTLLGLALSTADMKALRESNGKSLPRIKTDSFIIGCALRVQQCTFVSLDDTQLALADRCGLPAHHPRDYMLAVPPAGPRPQQHLFDP